MIQRTLQKAITDHFWQQKIVIIYGPRQAGKTTLVKQILSEHPVKSLYLNCDEPDINAALTNRTSTELRSLVGTAKLIVLDEAQTVHNIGLSLKLLVDTYPDLQIIATGSSSFELSNSVKEPLTGRAREFLLLPFSFSELAGATSPLEANRLLSERLVYGSYPEVVNADMTAKPEIISHLASSYLYRDILDLTRIKNPDVLDRLLKALALQIGSEVSFNELSGLLGVDKRTIEHYVELLEKGFILFRIGPLSRNLRKELGKMRKIYFYDLGIRNALIRNLNPLDLRNDVGALWENYLMVERLKNNMLHSRQNNSYFWRTYDQKEIDLVEESEGLMHGFEFKYKQTSYRPPKNFLQAYPGSTIELITRDDYQDFVMN